jgi:hypothetical protein
MNRLARPAIAAAVLLLCVPLAFIATLLLLPFWRWLEMTYGIESIGHSGPAQWCYLAAYAGLLAVAGMIWRYRRHETANRE